MSRFISDTLESILDTERLMSSIVLIFVDITANLAIHSLAQCGVSEDAWGAEQGKYGNPVCSCWVGEVTNDDPIIGMGIGTVLFILFMLIKA